jgi:hypothetical protein
MKINILTIFMTLLIGLEIQASTLNIAGIVLKDNTRIKRNEISSISMNQELRSIDFIQLKEGIRIESSEIKSIINFSEKAMIQAKVKGGDGSGG